MYEGPVQDLIDELGQLPGIGPKSAQRIAFHILSADAADVQRLVDALQLVKQTVKFCEVCFNIAEEARCRVCRDARRDPTAICVVEEPKDVVAISGLVSSAGPITSSAVPSAPSTELARAISQSASFARGWLTAPCRKSSSPPTPTSRAKPPLPTCRGCWSPWASRSPDWPAAFLSAAILSTRTRSPWDAPSRADDTSRPEP